MIIVGSEKYKGTAVGTISASATEQERREWLARYENYTLNRLLERIRAQAQRPKLSAKERTELESMVRAYKTLQLSMTEPPYSVIDPTADIWSSLKVFIPDPDRAKRRTPKGWLLTGSRQLPAEVEAQLERVLGGLPATGAPAPVVTPPPTPPPAPAPAPTTPIAESTGTIASLVNSIAQVLDNPISSVTSMLTLPSSPTQPASTTQPTSDVTITSGPSGPSGSSPSGASSSSLPTAGEGEYNTLSSLFGGLGALMPALAQPAALPGMAPVVIPQPISTESGGFTMPINPIILILLILGGWFAYKRWLS